MLRVVAALAFLVAGVTVAVETSRSLRAQAQDTCHGVLVVRTNTMTGHMVGKMVCFGGCAASGGSCENPKAVRTMPPVLACYCKQPTGLNGCLAITSGGNDPADYECLDIACAGNCVKSSQGSFPDPHSPRHTDEFFACPCVS